jgi:hypothetical protein
MSWPDTCRTTPAVSAPVHDDRYMSAASAPLATRAGGDTSEVRCHRAEERRGGGGGKVCSESGSYGKAYAGATGS